ncbi:serine/threonine protein kinase PRR1 [Sugiyamaella lignohabitans]|uniref:Serine/threonine protein kinase PRR1 n=1 Tax=Sugiyamaella lignohabitans TaxID=796027 RepID=A0A167D311_9ASCO|nr:serine/threonine protein kinase PRR1 [Sugiyamaella lignohabitans]ANB12416.1 serine/threonine protein kinase PRR1 [Sugiyamaella lignohabitans]
MPVEELLSLDDPAHYKRPLATLTDLGLSRKIDPENPQLVTRCGSEDYVPPELLMGQPYDGRQTDSWALGVLLYAVMEGRLPFDPPKNVGGGRSRGRTAHRIARVEWSWIAFKNDPPQEKLPYSEEWVGGMEIVEGCLQKRDLRLRAVDIAEMPWVKKAVCELERSDLLPVSDIFVDGD